VREVSQRWRAATIRLAQQEKVFWWVKKLYPAKGIDRWSAPSLCALSRDASPRRPSMEALQTLIPVFISLSLAGLVLAVGLNASREDLLYVLTRPKLLVRAILSVMMIPPIIAGILVAMLPIEPVVKAGIMLMAISPVPPLVPGKELGIGGRKNYAYGLYVAMALLTIISVPIVIAIVSTLFDRRDYVSVAQIAQTTFLSVLLPLAIGLAIRAMAQDFAGRVWRTIYGLSLILVLAAFLPIVIKVWPALTELVGNGTMAVMAVVSALCIATGHLLGGPGLRDRATLAIASSVRHPGIAMSISAMHFADPRVSAAILLFMLVGLVVSIPYTMWVKRHLQPPSMAAHA
jgi:BASS family bile acid:Na+ symporter